MSAVRTDCESISPALGSASRPSASRTLPRRGIVDALDGAVVVPPREVPEPRRPGREVLRQLPPGTPPSAPHRRSHPRSAVADASPADRPSAPPAPAGATALPAPTAHPSGPTDTHPQHRSQMIQRTPGQQGHGRSQTRPEQSVICGQAQWPCLDDSAPPPTAPAT